MTKEKELEEKPIKGVEPKYIYVYYQKSNTLI